MLNEREAHQKPVRFLSSAHPTHIREVEHAQRIRQRRAASRRVASRSKPPQPAPWAKLA
nr:hypothetical protein [Methylomarinum sp. Ch1-1]MDP4521166.1 hypothetical protein [Methylomarinum sp. Ch1-1]